MEKNMENELEPFVQGLNCDCIIRSANRAMARSARHKSMFWDLGFRI